MGLLIRNAHVIASPHTGDLGKVQSVLIEGDRISALGEAADAQASGAYETMDAEGRIIVPGLVNAHMHSWQAPLRGIALDWNLLEYLAYMHGQVVPKMTPDDVHIGTLAAAVTQIASGTTTLGDWCHANLTPDHSDAAIAALQEAGIRAVVLHGAQMGSGHRREEIERLLASGAFSKDGLLTLGLAIAGPLYSPPEVAEADLSLAREFDLIAAMHHSGGPVCPPEVWHGLIKKGLIGPHVNIVHGNTIGNDLLDRLVDAGVNFTITPEVEMNDGHGHPITGRLRKRGVAPAIGIDIESAISPNLLFAAGIAMVHQRALDAELTLTEQQSGTVRIHRVEALHWITGAGARALGLAAQVGVIAPGRQADLTIIDGRALDLWPNNDPIATVLRAGSAHVEVVLIAGRRVKSGHALAFDHVEDLMDELREAGERILAAADLPQAAFS